ncbi:acyl-CoA dehydrogenase family protein [Gordonia terrae]|uniref:Acyl-CoA dehydrogenase n=2 Tax=Gordonia terrae TaxID=2055 RepID=A0AAD0P133_9ACTN|nr:acyl-CoA dehydrogenase family protein [Gordonia terrae]VTR08434.1 Acyl-CoA dehydrogenases [Clostridioides difficile]ANY25496.1 acyl-CoA dehydrogenase [Gordonia terrae]AWO86244.1 acyl-CoA dehydrogenase [Gordonia terrae]VTS63586.1 Acyl-CoA dehydrogenase, short-chain specific [Gordonia terrae]GAB45908.1 putative acyl-CoA dehydrogenase [Gordonia terrae NBRC 100016]
MSAPALSPTDPGGSDLAVFRTEVREWLSGIAERKSATPSGPADLAVFRNLSDDEERRLLDAAREYRRKRYDAGYGAVTLAAEHGGRGLPASYASEVARAELEFDVPPSTELISVTTGLVGPAVAMFGTDEQREAYARPLLRTDLLACQLFSEPGAGSDLASLSCRAVRDGDGWRIDGQKVWSSGARFADLGMLLARTDPDLPKHKGITAFLIPLDAPGVEIRPIRQMSGGASFNEVFLNDVRIPDSARLGDIGQGWKIAGATLSFERTASGSVTRKKGGSVDELVGLAQQVGAAGDPVVRQQLADVYIRAELRKATADRVARAAAAGRSPGPAASVGKLMASDVLVKIGEIAADLLGNDIAVETNPSRFAWTEHLLGSPGYRLAGGTDQIQRNIIGERVLGLPPEPRADKDRPFSARDRR